MSPAPMDHSPEGPPGVRQRPPGAPDAQHDRPPTSPNENDHYLFDFSQLPDELFSAKVPVDQWLAHCKQVGAKQSGQNLAQLHPIPPFLEAERVVGISMYLFANFFPFVVPVLLLFSLVGIKLAWWALALSLGYFLTLLTLVWVFFRPVFGKERAKIFGENGRREAVADYEVGKTGDNNENIRKNQYLYTERNSSVYVSAKFVWPESLHRGSGRSGGGSLPDRPLIFCAVPHGVAPLGVTAYPLWSKLWNDRLCRWTTAPVVLKIPLVGHFIRKLGYHGKLDGSYIPATTKSITRALENGDNVGVALDGIAGMFPPKDKKETIRVGNRKGIVKIALRTGATLVPVYCFGHTQLWTPVVDPFGVLEAISVKINTSIVPFFGRFGWPMGPPRRVPVLVALGEPIVCACQEGGGASGAEPSQAAIDATHSRLVEGFMGVFERHKRAYGWGEKEVRVL